MEKLPRFCCISMNVGGWFKCGPDKILLHQSWDLANLPSVKLTLLDCWKQMSLTFLSSLLSSLYFTLALLSYLFSSRESVKNSLSVPSRVVVRSTYIYPPHTPPVGLYWAEYAKSDAPKFTPSKTKARALIGCVAATNCNGKKS
ncbi:hypothetical protein H5410_057883 [Solanum commersonii]|uniref:Uncharacterized protein n=1 Tax=Solanum commersonii TaxID=4109 RepID=A0A9J5WR13_SOLCO|nr:hypothetical protein H5410_057883 [Solanum commersonii]